jgi:hypothetical protein
MNVEKFVENLKRVAREGRNDKKNLCVIEKESYSGKKHSQ